MCTAVKRRVLLIHMLYVGFGGAVGSMLRHAVATYVQRHDVNFPIGTFTVNVVGCLAIGFLSEHLEGSSLDPRVRSAILVGLLGGFTTFSTFSLDTLKLAESRAYGLAMLNIIGSVVTCVAAAGIGYRLAKWWVSI